MIHKKKKINSVLTIKIYKTNSIIIIIVVLVAVS